MRLKLTPKLAVVFIFFALGLLLGVGALVYDSGRDALQAAAIKELEATAGEKKAALESWVHEREARLIALANSPYLLSEVSTLTKATAESTAAHDRLLRELSIRTGSGQSFVRLLILSPETGQVLVATDPGEEGEFRADRPYFKPGKEGIYTTPIYDSMELQEPAMTTAVPMKSEDGKIMALLVGRLNLDELNRIIQRRTGLHETDEVFLVNDSNLFVTQPRFVTDPAVLQEGIHTVPVQRCLEKRTGTILAPDYRGVPVIASYNWLPDREMCLIAKISQEEAFAPVQLFRKTLVWIALGTLVVIAFLAAALSRTLVQPIVTMQAVARRYERGELDVRLPETRHDELGLLARAFNQMAASLAEKEAKLREQADAALKESQQLLNSIVDNSSSLIYVLDTEGRFVLINKAFESLFGIHRETIYGKTRESILSKEIADEHRKNDLLVIQSKSPISIEERNLESDGIRHYLTVKSPLLDSAGHVYAVSGISTDVTERKRMEEALRESEERFRLVVQSAPSAMIVVDHSGSMTLVNSHAEQLFGYSAEELLGKRVEVLVPQRFQEMHSHSHQEYVTEPKAIAIGLRKTLLGVHKDGHEIVLEIGLAPYQSSEGLHVLALINDVTERRRAEAALREKEHLLSEAQHIGHVGSWSYDIFEDTLQYSDEMYHLLDVIPQEFEHTRAGLLALVYSADRTAVGKWLDLIVSGQQVKELEFRVFRKNGELRYLQTRGAVLFDTQDRPTRFTGTVQDITERKLSEIQIRQQINQLHALRRIDQSIASSFDQRFTLNVILTEVISQLQVDAADILILNPEAQLLEYAAGKGFRTKLVESARLPLGESHAGRSAKEKRLIEILNLEEKPGDAALQKLVTEEGIYSLVCVPLVVKGRVKGVLEVFHRTPLQPYGDWIDFLNTLAGQTAIAIENAALFTNLRATNEELFKAYDATIEGWSRAMDLRDRETENHTQRVTALTLDLARAMKIDESQLVHIRRGALLHDIGKLGVPDHILLKEQELTEEEWQIMHKHTELAYALLSPIHYLKPALPIPYFHHEKWDGTGYPLGLKGEQIPLEARIFAIVDVWDGITSDRPYRSAWTKEAALAYIREQSGKHFDPQVVDMFLKIVG